MKNFLKVQRRILFRELVDAIRFIQGKVPPKFACLIQTLLCFLIRTNVNFKFESDTHLFLATDGEDSRYFADLQRGFELYQWGMRHRGIQIFNSYCLHQVVFNAKDVVIDCGANYGDLWLELRHRIPSGRYIAIEPGPREAASIRRSLPNVEVLQMGLSNRNGNGEFYLASQTGDSSFIKPKTGAECINVSVCTLDRLTQEVGFDRCKLLKLEAEGFEPEILEGAEKFLMICDYIAVDGGPERGEAHLITLPAIANILIKSGFELIDINGPSYRALFARVNNSATPKDSRGSKN